MQGRNEDKMVVGLCGHWGKFISREWKKGSILNLTQDGAREQRKMVETGTRGIREVILCDHGTEIRSDTPIPP